MTQDHIEKMGGLEIQTASGWVRFYQYEPPSDAEIVAAIGENPVLWVRGCRWGAIPAYRLAVKHNLLLAADWSPWTSYSPEGIPRRPYDKEPPADIRPVEPVMHDSKFRKDGILYPEYR